MSRTVRSEVDFSIYNFFFALFFSLTVGVRSQKTRLSYAARRARSSAGLRSKNFPWEVAFQTKIQRSSSMAVHSAAGAAARWNLELGLWAMQVHAAH